MSATDIIQIVDYVKQSSPLQTSHSLINKINEQREQRQQQQQEQQQQQQTIILPKKCTETSSDNKFLLNESQSIRQSRINSLSHWPHFTPSNESMALAGWFSCNAFDRVICIYCNIICHHWTNQDDPLEVHSRLSPKCPFVLSITPVNNSVKVINEKFIEKFEPAHLTMAEISRREATFTDKCWTENCPNIEEIVRAGFFCPGISNTVTCFYCNGSLHKWGPNDKPIIEHARWFPHCQYIKNLCGKELYEKIQMSKKRMIPQNKIQPDEIKRLVSARLDLPNIQHLRLKYKLPIIKRCIEDQFRIKNDDFKSDTDLTMACLILQKQIDHIQGCEDKLIIPSKNKSTIDSNSSTKITSKQSLGECLICLTEEKQLACMPCGHLCACVPCGYALKSCPVCREKIQSFMKINS